jgi:hypothetical protein
MAPIRCCFDQTAVWHSDAARGPSTPSFNHLVGAREQRRREVKPKCLRGLLLILNLRLVRSSRDELLAAVDVVRRARECCVAHDVNG